MKEMQRQIEQSNFPGPPLLKINFGKYVFRFVRNRIFRRDIRERLHGFTVHWLYWKFGPEWFEKQNLLPEENRHVVALWLPLYWQWNNEKYLSPDAGPNRIVYPPGVVRELATLAGDIYILILADKLPNSLMKRLRDYNQYQGARYEVAVAAALIRGGFDIHWKKERGKGKIYEFDATHKVSKETIAVEAKSKVRKGAIHKKGELETFKDARADIISLYSEAISQQPVDKPFAIFIDINVAHDSSVVGPVENWTKQLLSLLEDESLFKDSKTPEYSVLGVTNSAWHYDGTDQTSEGRYILITPQRGNNLVQKPHTIAALRFAMNNFGIILDD